MELPIAAPYMIAQALPRTTVHYDIVEGQWKCTDACEASYYCVHNWYHASGQFTGIVDGSGYAGFQFKDGTTWTNFSIWETAHGMPSLVYCLSISCTLSAVLIDRIFALLAIINGIILQFAGFFALIDWYIS